MEFNNSFSTAPLAYLALALLPLGLFTACDDQTIIVAAKLPNLVPTGYVATKSIQAGQPTQLQFSALVTNSNSNTGANSATGPFKVRMTVKVDPAPPPAQAGVIFETTGTTLFTGSIAAQVQEVVPVVSISDGVLYDPNSTYTITLVLDPDAQLTAEANKSDNTATYTVAGSALQEAP